MNNRNFSYSPRNFKQPGNHFNGDPMRKPRNKFTQRSYPPYLRPPFGMTPEGLCLPSHMQAPPMFGPRGATIPPRMMGEYKRYSHNHQHTVTPKNDFNKQNASADNFWCETCDRGFKSEDILEKHKSEHQKCGIDGCLFIAHPNVVTKHIQMQHSSGLYNKIRNISTPEDIANWIQERKKNYPSKENIEKRRAQQKECHDRGEKLQPNKSRFNNSRKNNDRPYNNRENKRNKPNDKPTIPINKNSNPQKVSTHNIKSVKNEEPEGIEELYCNLKKFRGTSELTRHDLIYDDERPVVDDGIDIEDDEWQQTSVEPDQINANLSVCSALGNLISAYDTSSDDDESSSKKAKTTKIEKPITGLINSNTCDVTGPSNMQLPHTETVSVDTEKYSTQESMHVDKNNITDTVSNGNDSGPEEAKIEKIDTTQIPDANHPQRQGRKRKHSRGTLDKNNEPVGNNVPKKDVNSSRKYNGPQYLTKRPPNTLLEKLLEKDIRHERNVVLQCIHYVIQNNFFIKK